MRYIVGVVTLIGGAYTYKKTLQANTPVFTEEQLSKYFVKRDDLYITRAMQPSEAIKGTKGEVELTSSASLINISGSVSQTYLDTTLSKKIDPNNLDKISVYEALYAGGGTQVKFRGEKSQMEEMLEKGPLSSKEASARVKELVDLYKKRGGEGMNELVVRLNKNNFYEKACPTISENVNSFLLKISQHDPKKQYDFVTCINAEREQCGLSPCFSYYHAGQMFEAKKEKLAEINSILAERAGERTNVNKL
jgi:hypothetical protein